MGKKPTGPVKAKPNKYAKILKSINTSKSKMREYSPSVQAKVKVYRSMRADKRAAAKSYNDRVTRSHGNPKPTSKDLAKGAVIKKSAAKKAANTKANALTVSRGNPKPSNAILDANRKKKFIAGRGGLARKNPNAVNVNALTSSRANPKPSNSILNANKNKKLRNALLTKKKIESKAKARGTNTRPTTGVYRRTPGGM